MPEMQLPILDSTSCMCSLNKVDRAKSMETVTPPQAKSAPPSKYCIPGLDSEYDGPITAAIT